MFKPSEVEENVESRSSLSCTSTKLFMKEVPSLDCYLYRGLSFQVRSFAKTVRGTLNSEQIKASYHKFTFLIEMNAESCISFLTEDPSVEASQCWALK